MFVVDGLAQGNSVVYENQVSWESSSGRQSQTSLTKHLTSNEEFVNPIN